MARPEPKPIVFEIDGREVTANEGTMLVDAARSGDVEIPYFCYEPKLGPPVVVWTTMPSLTGVEHEVWSFGMPSTSTRHIRQAPTGGPSLGS